MRVPPRIATALAVALSSTVVTNGFGIPSQLSFRSKQVTRSFRSANIICSRTSTTALFNIYDDWRSDAVVDILPLDEDNVRDCLDDFINSDYGQQMFGCHERPASVGITGTLEFVELCGPEVVLSLDGHFWHKRSTVLGRAAMWLNARMPEIVEVRVEDMEDLNDSEDVRDEFTGELLYVRDKRAPDFNGDRETMEYQGIDPDMRGPFPQGVGGLRAGGSMINPT